MKNGQLVILVTGANGFVGRNLVPRLIDSGMIVRRVQRRSSSDLEAIIIGEIGPQTNWEAALPYVDVVVHLAARVHHPNEEHAADIYRSVNTEGTLRLAQCAATAGVRQFIYLSTALVNGACTDGRQPFCEQDPLMPRGVYGASKAAAEAGLGTLAKETGMPITIIRTPLIHGPGAMGNFRLLVNAVERGIPLPFGSIRNRRAFLGVENLASFIVHRLLHPDCRSNVFLLADNEHVSTPEFVRLIAAALRKKSLVFPLPLLALKALLAASGRSEVSDSVVGSMEIDISKALGTGWRPSLSLSQGLEMALRR